MEYVLLAKSAAKGEDGEPESLARHTWYVLSRLADMIHVRQDLPARLGVPRLWHILYWSAFLHDFGKAASGFQARLRGGPRWNYRHEVLSLAFVDWIEKGITQDERLWLVAAISSHHKDAEEIEREYAPPDELGTDILVPLLQEFSEQTLELLWGWLTQSANSWINDLSLARVGVRPVSIVTLDRAKFIVLNEGVERVRFWLKRYRRFATSFRNCNDFSSIAAAMVLRGYIINSDHSASAHAGAMPMCEVSHTHVLAPLKLTVNDLYGHQRQAASTVGSALLIAPTGSGKTEAALLWAAAQNSENARLPRLFYTLPYQASMNAMRLRLEGVFGKGLVGLQHGRSLLVLYRVLMDRNHDPSEAARQARWMRNLVQLNYPPVRVFSPYQMLKGMYRLKGYEAVLSDYHDAVFVFDEIHAYEVKRLAMIFKTIEFLRQHFNARFFIMSATFPKLIRERLIEVLGSASTILADNGLFAAFQRHQLFLLEGSLFSEAGIRRIVSDAISGKSVLVVCNTVSFAQAVTLELQKHLIHYGTQIELLHSRFNLRDRIAKEKMVSDTTGSRSKHRRAVVLVATQVVEVSLDIDLDTVYSDPAPLEALIQRFGRVNRRRLHPTAVPVFVYSAPDDGQGVYDAEIVQRTVRILRRENGRPINEAAIGEWLDEIYADQLAERWRDEYDHAAREFEAACIRSIRPFDSDSQLQDQFDQLFDGLEVVPVSLYEEYQQLKTEDPIRANELLVPISMRRFYALRKSGAIMPRIPGEPYIVNANYSYDQGLMFD
ncbi:MAG: CRISPR-associated helicase Cas3' [Caldilineaceae bacterium]|nr:CRISPR-associated helicase Cas3' [Caldilineaceae bacterium]